MISKTNKGNRMAYCFDSANDQLDYDAEQDSIFVEADKTRIDRVITNLLTNCNQIHYKRTDLC